MFNTLTSNTISVHLACFARTNQYVGHGNDISGVSTPINTVRTRASSNGIIAWRSKVCLGVLEGSGSLPFRHQRQRCPRGGTQRGSISTLNSYTPASTTTLSQRLMITSRASLPKIMGRPPTAVRRPEKPWCRKLLRYMGKGIVVLCPGPVRGFFRSALQPAARVFWLRTSRDMRTTVSNSGKVSTGTDQSSVWVTKSLLHACQCTDLGLRRWGSKGVTWASAGEKIHVMLFNLTWSSSSTFGVAYRPREASPWNSGVVTSAALPQETQGQMKEYV